VSPEIVRANRFALLCCLLFLLAGLPWIWRPGIQTDEALFSAGIYAPFADDGGRVKVFGHDYSLMVMSYVGALKARIWSPILRFAGISAGSVRIPALVIGAISVWWFYRLMLRTLGVRAAVIGCALLAADPLYLLTIRWDWGPVALQHVLLIGGMLGVVAWWQDRKLVWLGLGFFAFGLAMWDKALFAWSLVGLTVACAVCFPRQLLSAIRPKPLAVAAVWFLVGASPLILYNVRKDWTTFRSNANISNEDVVYKARLVLDTVDGSALFGSVARNEDEGPLRTPDRWLEQAVVGASVAAGSPKHTVQLWMLGASLLFVPLVWRTPGARGVAFALVFALVTWAQMVPLKNGGTGAHHSILLWPAPAMAIAASMAYVGDRTARPWRWVAGVCAIGMLSGWLVTCTYYRDVLRNGGTLVWTEAFYPAVRYLQTLRLKELCVVDWGFFDNLRLFGRGRLPLNVANDPAGSDDDRKYCLMQVSDPEKAFVAHTVGNEVAPPGLAGRIVKFAEEHGYRKVNTKVFADTNGRPTVEVFSFEKVP